MNQSLKQQSEKKAPFFIRYKWWLTALAVLLVIFVVVYVLAARSMARLDARIQEVFDGPKWSIPARVYARPLELYAGQTIDRLSVASELQRLGYQLTETQASKPGQYTE